MTTYADRTKYPSFYKKIYWGGFRARPEEEIIKNRNKFIEDHPGIKQKRVLNRVREHVDQIISEVGGGETLFDHREFYWTPEAVLFVISPYMWSGREALQEAGFQQIDNLYSTGTITYLLTIPHNAILKKKGKSKCLFGAQR